MKLHHRLIATVAAAGLVAAPVVALAPAASAAPTSLADVLLADTKNGAPTFDKDRSDFDILTAAVLTVLAKRPHSDVAVLTDASVKLTAFIPNDSAFKATAKVLGIEAGREQIVANRLVRALGVATVEDVLLYHVVPGARITAKDAAAADGAKLETALGKSIKVNVTDKGIVLRDLNRKVANPMVIATDINKAKGNVQIAHVIDGVLLPI